MMMNVPLRTTAVKLILMQMMAVEPMFSDRFGRGANGGTGLDPRGLGPWITSRWQGPTSRGGRGLAEGGGSGAARADGVRSGVV